MPELDTQDREELKDSQYAYIDEDGNRKLPIPDEEHVRNAIQRFGQTDFNGNESAKRDAARKILRKADDYGIEVSEDDDVKRAAK
jgi:hypothetical protein